MSALSTIALISLALACLLFGLQALYCRRHPMSIRPAERDAFFTPK
ncbi:hypothetical protein [Roseibium sp. SCP14]